MPVSTGTPIAPAGQPIVATSGHYSFLGVTSSTSAALGVGTLRAAPVYVPTRVTLDRIGAEITAAGDPLSKLRLGIYRDNGNIYPGTLLLDAGTIAADAIAVAEITISQVLEPGVYWLAAAVQEVTVTQPTVRTALEIPFCPIGTANTSVASDLIGVSDSSITGALPSTFHALGAGGSSSGAVPRVFVRAA